MDIRELLNQLADQEQQLQTTQFLAPCVRQGKIRTRVAGLLYTFVAQELLFEGWGISNLPCLHAGLAADYAEVIWNKLYRVSSNPQDDICDYSLARNLVMLTMAITCEAAIDWIHNGVQQSFTITLKDLSVQELR